MQALHLGTTSFSLSFEFRIAAREQVIATAETVYVMVDTHTLAKQPLTDDFRARLERGALMATADHAGWK